MSAICTSPLAKGLFRRIILENSIVANREPSHSFRSMEEALSSGREVLARYHAENLSDLRRLPTESIAGSMDTEYYITVDGYVLTETPCQSYQKCLQSDEAILHRFNLHGVLQSNESNHE